MPFDQNLKIVCRYSYVYVQFKFLSGNLVDAYSLV